MVKMKQLLNDISEAEFQQQIIDAAHLYGWTVAHFGIGKVRGGKWVTPVQADGAGFTDLVIVRRGTVIFAECKREKGRLSDNQHKWATELIDVSRKNSFVGYYVWRPSDWENILNILK